MQITIVNKIQRGVQLYLVVLYFVHAQGLEIVSCVRHQKPRTYIIETAIVLYYIKHICCAYAVHLVIYARNPRYIVKTICWISILINPSIERGCSTIEVRACWCIIQKPSSSCGTRLNFKSISFVSHKHR